MPNHTNQAKNCCLMCGACCIVSNAFAISHLHSSVFVCVCVWIYSNIFLPSARNSLPLFRFYINIYIDFSSKCSFHFGISVRFASHFIDFICAQSMLVKFVVGTHLFHGLSVSLCLSLCCDDIQLKSVKMIRITNASPTIFVQRVCFGFYPKCGIEWERERESEQNANAHFNKTVNLLSAQHM